VKAGTKGRPTSPQLLLFEVRSPLPPSTICEYIDGSDSQFVTFRVRGSRGEMYICHGRLCVCLSFAASPHLLHGPGCNLGNGRARECPPVVQYWADLQSVHGFRCYDNIQFL